MKLYVLVREDLGMPYAAVQAGHALAQWMLEHTGWANGILVYLGVEDSDRLDMWCAKLKSKGYAFSEFFEPDINSQRTAIACYTGKNIFSKLKLLGE